MADMKSLLVELGTEELPPKALPELAQAFFDGICAGLEKRGVAFDRDGARPLYSPRRLAVLLPAVALRTGRRRRAKRSARTSTSAWMPRASRRRRCSASPPRTASPWTQLEKITDGKGERFVARTEKPGAARPTLLPEIINEAVKALPIPKPMRWGNRDDQLRAPGALAGDAARRRRGRRRSARPDSPTA